MSEHQTFPDQGVSSETTPEQLFALIAAAADGEKIAGLSLIDTDSLPAVFLPNDKSLAKTVVLGDHLVLIQPDGTVEVLLDGAINDLTLISDGQNLPLLALKDVATPFGDWPTLGDAPLVDLRKLLPLTGVENEGAGQEEPVSVNDPLIGLDINPLLPPTDYLRPKYYEDPISDGGIGLPDIGVSFLGDLAAQETDGPVQIKPSDVIDVTALGTAEGEILQQVLITLPGLPAGTRVSDGSLTREADGTLTFAFDGTPEDFAELIITLPKDFSTESRIDYPEGDLVGTLQGVSNFGFGDIQPITIHVEDEADLDITGPGALTLDETDAPVLIRPADGLLPVATDIDGSEVVTSVALSMTGLPAGTRVSLDNGVTFAPLTDLSFDLTLAQYERLLFEVPADFSTTNPDTTISGVLVARTNEGGLDTRFLDVTINDESDVFVTAPAVVSGVEDGGGVDGGGVVVDLGLNAFVTDIDGSEDNTVVEIVFTGAPDGLTFLGGGSYDEASDTWTGTMAQANVLRMDLPGDYSGTFQAAITATSPEGVATATQSIEITPAGDVDISVTELSTAETDAPVIVTPSDAWQVTISDSDPNLPRETITEIVLTLNDMPPGVLTYGVPAGTIAYDTVAGGTLVFTGTEAEYLALQLQFPADYSTESPAADGLTITGTIAATSTEGTGGPTPVSLRITPEGDAEIDDTLPDTVPDETDAATPLVPADLLLPAATDADGSEAIESLTLVIDGLPGDGSFSVAGNVTGLPAGATAVLSTLADGSSRLTISMDTAGVGDVASAYGGIALSLPADFSTANRSDLSGTATTLPLNLTLSIQTDEDQNPGDDTAIDGTVTTSRTVDIGFESDVFVTAPAVVSGVEDGGGVDGGGVIVDLGLNAFVTDIDGSEDNTVVEIVFTGAPDGLTFLGGGSYDEASDTWTGTMAQANVLRMDLPGDYSGTFQAAITATSPEGVATAAQSIEITPAGDVDISVTELSTAETDAPVIVTPSDAWQVTISDSDPNLPRETITEIVLTLNDMPPGVLTYGVPAGTIAYDTVAGGTLVFTGTEAEYLALQLQFPADYSTESPAADGLTITGTIAATSTEGTGGPTPVSLRITPEGDAEIDDTLPDTVPDETDAATPLVPADLLLPAATDADGSEAIESLTLVIDGLPGDGSFTVAGNVTGLPAGATAVLSTLADGSSRLTIAMDTAGVGDVATAYGGIALSLPADFSTANRSDLSGAATTLPLNLTLSIQTDEDQNPGDDTAIDGTVTTSRTVDIGFEADIDLTAPARIDAREDGGFIGAPAPGVTVDLEIEITVDDADGSEAEASGDARFDAVVTIAFQDLPAGTTVNTGTLTGQDWSGTVAQAEALTLTFAGDVSGVIPALITVTTAEGAVSTPQVINITPTPDIVITGEVISTETDGPLQVKVSDFVDVVITDPDESLYELAFSLPGLPLGTTAIDETTGNPVGSFSTVGGTLTFTYDYLEGSGDPSPADVILVFPTDYSTTNPADTLSATLTVTSIEGGIINPPVSGAIAVTIDYEGDVEIVGDTITLAETDAGVEFTPADHVLGNATDSDGSESVISYALTFNALPAGTEVSYDGGGSFAAATATLDFLGTPAEYALLVLRLPADYSTENPASTLTGTIVAFTDEAGTATGSIAVTVSAEGDIAISGTGTIALSENDAPTDSDEDTTTSNPVEFALKDALTAAGTDADGSESLAQVDVTISGLPAGTLASTDGGSTFVAATTTYSLTPAEYDDLVFRLPNDFSTENPPSTISGNVTFTTDEALLAGETDTGPNDGVETAPFTVTVSAEQDVEITASDVTVIEDLGVEIPLNLDAAVTDIDGSESITNITLTFADLPTNGPVVLSNGASVTPGANQVTGLTLADLQGLGITSFPTHFSGIIPVTVTVVTDEGNPAGTQDTFDINVTPVAEPEITLSVQANPPGTQVVGPDNFIVKEDTSFALTIDATTPDQDGSESLTRIVIENMPAGWVPSTGGTVDLALFTSGAGDIASATVSGTTLTITLNAGLTDFNGVLQVTPLSDDDRDVETILGDDLIATVTSVDTATGLPSDTATAQDGVDVDVDAVVDAITLSVSNRSTNENRGGRRVIDLGVTNLALTDSDGSESFDNVALTISIATESDVFDVTDPDDLLLQASNGTFASHITIVQTGSTADSVSFLVEPTAGTTDAEFADAIESLRLRFPQHFSGVATVDGTVNWSETNTGDAETDAADNPDDQTFQTTLEVRPISQASLTAGAFVVDSDFAETGSPTEVSATSNNGSTIDDETLTILESTDDGSGEGQVDLYLRVDASTPDTDGSEQLSSVTIANIPTSWIDEQLSGTDLLRGSLFSADGTTPISNAEFDKIDTATYDSATGVLTLTFVDNVTDFSASVLLQPALYEDYDADRDDSDPFTADGNFFGADLLFELTTTDDNTNRTDGQTTDVTLDVDVAPVNNIATILALPTGNEQVIDDAGGVWEIPFLPVIKDQDGSEKIGAVVIRDLPKGIVVFANDPNNPGGPKIPALLTSIGATSNDWSLSDGQWLSAELRGIPTHTAGDFPVVFDVVSKEDDGGVAVTRLNQTLVIDPVADGGDPSENVATVEDTAIRIQLDGNIIDNFGNSPQSPEAALDGFTISNIVGDSEGRLPRFFNGPPVPDPASPGDYLNELVPSGGTLTVLPSVAGKLYVLPGQDSNEDLQFDVSGVYYETIKLTEFTTGTGTITVSIKGIADDPIVEFQERDPDQTPGGIDTSTIDASFRPDEVVDMIANENRVYGYAGNDTGIFRLDMRLTDEALDVGVAAATGPVFQAADPLSGTMTEVTFSGPTDFDGSETIYYIISNVDPSISLVGGTPIDPTGSSYVVTQAQLPNLGFAPTGVTEPTYYDMTLNAIVTEDDVDTSSIALDPMLPPDQAIAQVLADLDALPGGSVTSEDFTVVVLPDGGPGGVTCTPDQELPLPVLSVIGSGNEDETIELTLQIAANPPFYDSIGDLASLPNGVVGDFGLSITLPPGATLSANPSSAVLFDPISGTYVIDIAALGVDPTDPTMAAGKLLYTPPPHESSPSNPFPDGDTFGPDDPYDGLPGLEFDMILNNFTCNTVTPGSGTFPIEILPVVDGPQVIIANGGPFDEDVPFSPDIRIEGIDPGERLTGDVVVTIDGASGGRLLDSLGTPVPGGITQPDGSIQYTLAASALSGLQISATEHYSGPMVVRVSATAEDIDGNTKTNTSTRTYDITPVADTPTFDFDTVTTDPETGLPIVDNSSGTPVITIIEDTPFTLFDVLDADSPDQDGSEVVTYVLGVIPDYLEIIAPAGSGSFVDNGDGTFTIGSDIIDSIQIALKDEHARTPDSLDSTLPNEIPLTLTVNTIELANSDETSAKQDFIVKVRPDADVPTLMVGIDPTTGTEDQPTPYELSIGASTSDLHEKMSFQISGIPDGGKIIVGGVEVPIVAGVAIIDGPLVGLPVISFSGLATFFPVGNTEFVPPANYAGNVALTVIATTSDTDGTFTDTQDSPPQDLNLTIDVAPDLDFTIVNTDIDLTETDAAVTHDPSDDFTIDVTDPDGSEVATVTYTILGVPDGTSYSVSGGAAVPVTGDLVFTGTEAEFEALTISFPADFATNGTPLNGTIAVTTNEGGSDGSPFTIEVDGTLDLTVTTTPSPTAAAETGTPLELMFGIAATVTDSQTTPSEWLEEVVVTFTDRPPAGTTASAGTLSADRSTLTLTRGALAPADFALLVAALSVTVPGDFGGAVAGTLAVSTNHGTAPDESFAFDINDAPDVSAPVDIDSTDANFNITFAELLANTTDADGPLTLSNFSANDTDVGVTVNADSVDITVPDGYVGTPTLTYTVTDGATVPASSVATADLNIDTLQMEATGTVVTNPDGGGSYALMDNVIGDAAATDFAKGTDQSDAVVFADGTADYADIEGFNMLDGNDLVDLSGSTTGRGFEVDLGGGDDWAIGGDGADVLRGGAGSDRLQGGLGADTLTGGDDSDIFILGPALDVADIITDYEAPGTVANHDQVDLTNLVSGVSDITGIVDYNSVSGDLSVNGTVAATLTDAGGGIPPQVEVIFENASNVAETTVI